MKHEAPQGSEAHAHGNGQVHVHDDRDHLHAPLPLNPDAAIRNEDIRPPVAQPAPIMMGIDPVVVQGQGEWFTRELLGGWLALADARGISREDFLTERCALMLMRLSTIESQLQIATTTVQALSVENDELHRKIDDCGCHDEEASAASPV